MEFYLRKFHKINQKVIDQSDYENFYTAITQFLQTHRGQHQGFLKSLKKAIIRFKTPYLTSLAYFVLSSMVLGVSDTKKRKNGPIPRSLVQMHFKKRAIRGAILAYINCFNLSYLDNAITKKLILDPHYISLELFKFIEMHPAAGNSIMERLESEYAFKQLSIIENCKVDFNVEYYLAMLGAASKIRALRAYEAFTQLFIRNSDEPPYEVDERLMFCRQILFNVPATLKVESPANFLVFGFNFIAERDEIIQAFETDDTSHIRRLIFKYSHQECEPELKTPRELCYSKRIAPLDAKFTEQADFDFLFNASSHKSIMDCMEI